MPSIGKPTSKEEAEFQAEDDARTLRHAAEIQQDSKRLKKARKKLKELAKENEQTANLMKKTEKRLNKTFGKGTS